MGGQDELDRMVCLDIPTQECFGLLLHTAIQTQQLAGDCES